MLTLIDCLVAFAAFFTCVVCTAIIKFDKYIVIYYYNRQVNLVNVAIHKLEEKYANSIAHGNMWDPISLSFQLGVPVSQCKNVPYSTLGLCGVRVNREETHNLRVKLAGLKEKLRLAQK